jgi:hypothetical protein
MSFWDWITSLFLRQNPSVKTAIEEQNIVPKLKEEEIKAPETLEEVAQSLVIFTPSGVLTEYRTVKNIRDWVNQHMVYKRYRRPRLIEDIWNEKTGDCTDYSRLIEEMALSVGIRGIHRAHGYSSGEKHDWLIYEGNIIDGTGTHANYEYVGEGFW